MKRLSTALVALALLTIPSALSATTKNVDITQAGFTPGKVTIDYGDTVTWTNKDAGTHQVLADQLAFPTSPVLAQSQTYSYTFMKSGSFGYRDALHTNRRGTVVVRAGVSITAAPSLLAYGKSATLSGSISSGAVGDTVNIDAMECGKTGFTRLTSVKSAANGAWSSPVKPALNTVYQASWRNTKSAQLTAKVKPGLSLKRVRAHRFTASLVAAQAFTGKYVVLQRYAKAKRTWKTVKRVTLRTAKAGITPTIASSTKVRLAVPRGTRLRLLLTADQAGACYATTLSSTIRA
jgi:plastocyanin